MKYLLLSILMCLCGCEAAKERPDPRWNRYGGDEEVAEKRISDQAREQDVVVTKWGRVTRQTARELLQAEERSQNRTGNRPVSQGQASGHQEPTVMVGSERPPGMTTVGGGHGRTNR